MRQPAAERARAGLLLLLSALALDAVLAVLLDSTSAVSGVLLGAFLLAPLALPVPGLLRRDRRAYAWASLCLTPHFVYGLTELVANPALRWVAATMLVLSLAVMVALVAYLRLTRG
ncbi:MAG TPA: DUF2069 domain-containing protein [Steroidobacteraceae bacterium]|nr:DUF2069 domain-containing protein [Steroidobacteraceae bacterium]